MCQRRYSRIRVYLESLNVYERYLKVKIWRVNVMLLLWHVCINTRDNRRLSSEEGSACAVPRVSPASRTNLNNLEKRLLVFFFET